MSPRHRLRPAGHPRRRDDPRLHLQRHRRNRLRPAVDAGVRRALLHAARLARLRRADRLDRAVLARSVHRVLHPPQRRRAPTRSPTRPTVRCGCALRNGEVVRGLGMGDIVLDRWSGAQSHVVAAHATLVERGAAMHALTKFARLTVQTALLCVGAWLAIDREISPGAMMAASIIMGRALAPIEQMVGQWKRIVALPVRLSPPRGPVPGAADRRCADRAADAEGRDRGRNAVVWPPTAEPPGRQGRELLAQGR